jgi:hypothetical protein
MDEMTVRSLSQHSEILEAVADIRVNKSTYIASLVNQVQSADDLAKSFANLFKPS